MRKSFLPRWICKQLSRWHLRQIYRFGLVIAAIAIALIWQQFQQPTIPLRETLSTNWPIAAINDDEASAEREPIQPIPVAAPYSLDKYALGKRLFKEPSLSKNGQLSCASCHQIELGGADRNQYSKGIANTPTQVNTPTVFNIAYNFRFNWDGQYDSLTTHTDKLIQNPAVMGGTWEDILQKIADIKDYQQAFKTIYPNGINRENIVNAIVTYETALTTPNAPFDRYLRGDTSAISKTAKSGYDLFKAYGCASCHQGTNIGGNMFQKFGAIGDYFGDRGNITPADLGRYNVTGSKSDRYVFRVPSLRNVAITPPYLHDGSAATLKEAIEIMVKYQLGRPMPEPDIEQIVDFLETLTGEVPNSDATAAPSSF